MSIIIFLFFQNLTGVLILAMVLTWHQHVINVVIHQWYQNSPSIKKHTYSKYNLNVCMLALLDDVLTESENEQPTCRNTMPIMRSMYAEMHCAQRFSRAQLCCARNFPCAQLIRAPLFARATSPRTQLFARATFTRAQISRARNFSARAALLRSTFRPRNLSCAQLFCARRFSARASFLRATVCARNCFARTAFAHAQRSEWPN